MPVPYQFRRAVEAVIKPLLQIAKMSDYIVWTDWTPTVTQNAVSVSCAVTEAKYCVIGKVCHIYARLVITGTGTAANKISIGGQPAAARTTVTNLCIGSFWIWDESTGLHYSGGLFAPSATEWRMPGWGSVDGWGYAPNVALAAGDMISFSATFRVA